MVCGRATVLEVFSKNHLNKVCLSIDQRNIGTVGKLTKCCTFTWMSGYLFQAVRYATARSMKVKKSHEDLKMTLQEVRVA
jgi:hypothetical protein